VERTTLDIPKMDCASEERLVRMALQDVPTRRLEFDLLDRRVTVVHEATAERILAVLAPLNLGARVAETRAIDADASSEIVDTSAREAKVLVALLGINAIMFVVELTAGWLAESTGLISDSLDMFADAAVYGVSLYSVGKTASLQKLAARLSGYLQLLLAIGALAEVVRRLLFGSDPDPPAMMAVALLALAANVTCLALLARHREGGAHMRASWIFSTNDVIANIGVIAAGALVAWTASALPDLLIGALIALVVLAGGVRILRLARGV
jgi:Co/Zn/Cd efflux system component